MHVIGSEMRLASGLRASSRDPGPSILYLTSEPLRMSGLWYGYASRVAAWEVGYMYI